MIIARMMTRMSKINQKILNTLLAVDIGIIIFCMLSGHRNWLYTTQIGYFTSALVIAASMVSYRRMIEKRLEYEPAVTDTERDELDKIDDPLELYDEEQEDRELSRDEFAKVVQAEKAKQKASKRSITQVMKDAKGSFTLYRIGAYLLLVLGFFYLNRHHYLHIPSYLFSLSVPPAIVVIILLMDGRAAKTEKSMNNEEG